MGKSECKLLNVASSTYFKSVKCDLRKRANKFKVLSLTKFANESDKIFARAGLEESEKRMHKKNIEQLV